MTGRIISSNNAFMYLEGKIQVTTLFNLKKKLSVCMYNDRVRAGRKEIRRHYTTNTCNNVKQKRNKKGTDLQV